MEDSEVRGFEEFLKNYRFRSPRPLPAATPARSKRPLLKVLIPITALSLIVGVWKLSSVPNSKETGAMTEKYLERMPTLTLAGLNQVAYAHPDQLDRVLIQSSPVVLPEVENTHGILHSLSSDNSMYKSRSKK